MKTHQNTPPQGPRAGRKKSTQAGTSPLSINEEGRVHIALDVHARRCVIGVMRDSDGAWLGEQSCPTQAEALREIVSHITAGEKWLAFEEGGMSLWLIDALRPLVQRLIVCDPRENALIGRSARKCDAQDVRSLCRLMRLGELKEVWHSQDALRRDLLLAAKQYDDIKYDVVRRKNMIKALYRRCGVMVSDTATIYSAKGRLRWLALLPDDTRRLSALCQYGVLDALEQAWEAAWQRLKHLGRQCPEIAIFKQVPGVGEVCAHLFSALVSDPHRFATRQKLWRYSKLSITSRTSDGKPLGYERLERHGNSKLKEVSYHAWKGAITSRGDNEVKRFYAQSELNTGSKRHARLNTQRKILEVLWTLWRRREAYDPRRFSAAQAQSAESTISHEDLTPNTTPGRLKRTGASQRHGCP